MTHARTTIREAAAAALAGLATTGSEVYPSRVFPPAADGHRPSLGVYTLEESRVEDGDGLDGAEVSRALALAVEIRAPMSPTWDDTIDQVAAEVEAALWDAVYGTPGGALADLVDGLEYTGIEIDLGEPDQPYGIAVLSVLVHYRARSDDPTTAL